MNRVLDLYCTRRGAHTRRDLYRLIEHDGVLYLAKRHFGPGAASTGPGPRVHKPVRLGTAGNRTLRCPACGQRPVVTVANLARLLDAGLTEVDVSRLPC